MKCTWIAPKKIKKSPSPHSKMKTQWNSHKWCYLQPSSPILTVFLGPPKNSVLQGLVSLLHGLFILMFCLSQQLAPFGIRTRFPKWLPVTNNATYKHGTGRSKYLSGVSNGYIYDIYIDIPWPPKPAISYKYVLAKFGVAYNIELQNSHNSP